MPKGVVDIETADVVIVGAGVAGLSTALALPDLSVHLVTKTRLGSSGSSPWAQGGIAAAVGSDDSPALHAADTLAVAAGLADDTAVGILTEAAPRIIHQLAVLGVRFDRQQAGFALGREAAHSRNRIVHAHDATGAEVVRGLTEAALRSPRLRPFEQAFACDLHLEGGNVRGVLVRHGDHLVLHRARAVVLATGGIGQAYSRTTNPPEATGDGLALAARVGARLADVEFVQFHPTALNVPADPMPLLSEALRGRGALIVDETGRRILVGRHPLAELAPRDFVAREIARHLAAGGQAFLDARGAIGDRFPADFPSIFQICLDAKLDPRQTPLPIAPAAHYHMGGISVDYEGRSSVPGLWACGETAATGVHGANRLASNSLLEAAVFGERVGASIRFLGSERLPRHFSIPTPPQLGAAQNSDWRARLRALMWDEVGLLRTEHGLRSALADLDALAAELPANERSEEHNLATVARIVTQAALNRRESRGAHLRLDYPEPDERWHQHQLLVVDKDGRVSSPGVTRSHERQVAYR